MDAPRFGGDGGALVGDRRRSCAFEFQEEACLSGVLTYVGCQRPK